MPNKQKDGTGRLYQSRASLLFSVRGAAANLSSALPRAENDGVLTSIERMRINSAIVALQTVVEESSKNWADVIKPKLLAAIQSQPVQPTQFIENETEETQPERTEDNNPQGEDTTRPDDNCPDAESGDIAVQNQDTGD